ncbi:hypothetical protein OH799_28135 [Nocardia sp. NBC_00881]|uniref:hypothetical protein n=1 Tax=Nocardia sp. NBC_00881 TaxID=2975995 RepID=UPI00386B0A80|nr:hypothetical protein OH799_28135 [Nocardia sp. NBC_00881]
MESKLTTIRKVDHCSSPGVGIASAGDLVYTSEDSYPAARLHQHRPDARRRRRSPRLPVAEISLLGERLPALTAKAAGLFTAVVPDDIDAIVEAAAAKIASGPRRA